MSPAEFSNVTAVAKANVYFDGKVVSHTILFADGSKKRSASFIPVRFISEPPQPSTWKSSRAIAA